MRTAETPREAETQHSAASKSPFRSQQIPRLSHPHSAASKSPFRSQKIPRLSHPHSKASKSPRLDSLIRIPQPANPRASTLSSAFCSQQIPAPRLSHSQPANPQLYLILWISLSLTVLQARLLCVSVFAGCENSLTVWSLDRGSLHHPLSFSISPLLHLSFSYGNTVRFRTLSPLPTRFLLLQLFRPLSVSIPQLCAISLLDLPPHSPY